MGAGGGLPSSITRTKSSRKRELALAIGATAPSARAQSTLPLMRPKRASIVSRSSMRPSPSTQRWSIFSIQVVPSRQGEHLPQLS